MRDSEGFASVTKLPCRRNAARMAFAGSYSGSRVGHKSREIVI
jgi:hypothetical protein